MTRTWKETALEFLGTEVDQVLLSSARILSVLRRRVDNPAKRDRLRHWMSFYLEKSYPEQPARFFSLPKSPPPDVRVEEERPFCDGRFRILSFPSRYKVRNPEVEARFERFRENRAVYLAHWSHGDPGRNTLVCCHGYSLGDPWQAQRMFRVARLYNLGMDVALFVTPFHWKRASTPALRFAPPFPFLDPVFGLEGFGQAVHDLASCFLYLSQSGASRIGLVGASLGGYLAALFVSVTALADMVCLIVPLVSFHGLRLPMPFHPVKSADKRFQEEVSKIWKIHSPLSHKNNLPPERCLIIAARGDRLCPFEDVQKLYLHWGKPEHTFLSGGHVFFFPRHARGKAWYQFLKRHRFAPNVASAGPCAS